MSSAEEEIAMTQPSRRQFLQRAALAAASGSLCQVLPSPGHTMTVEPLTTTCTNVRSPMSEVEDKVAFITGGSSGIGLGIARAFSAASMKVAIGYRTKSHLEEALSFFKSNRDNIHAINVDVTDRRSMENAAAETVRVFGKIHVLVNNAGVVGFAPLSRTTYDDWDWMMNVNVNGVFNGVRAFLPSIRAHGEGGHIISTSSIGGLVAASSAASYIASKFAVTGAMEALRDELANTNVGVSVYCPGMVRSNLAFSSRNRPSSRRDTGFDESAETIANVQKIMADPKLSMDPLTAGQFVLRGMRNNDLYILSHSEIKEILEDRHAALLASFPSDAAPNMQVGTSLRKSVYQIERKRILCARAKRA